MLGQAAGASSSGPPAQCSARPRTSPELMVPVAGRDSGRWGSRHAPTVLATCRGQPDLVRLQVVNAWSPLPDRRVPATVTSVNPLSHLSLGRGAHGRCLAQARPVSGGCGVRRDPSSNGNARSGRDRSGVQGQCAATARLAEFQAAKRTGELIPLCHPLPITHCAVDFEIPPSRDRICITASARLTAGTGVEMEALTAVSVAALTISMTCARRWILGWSLETSAS